MKFINKHFEWFMYFYLKIYFFFFELSNNMLFLLIIFILFSIMLNFWKQFKFLLFFILFFYFKKYFIEFFILNIFFNYIYKKYLVFIVNKCYIFCVSYFIYAYFYFKFSDYNFLYQYWYKYARNQKNTYLAIRFRLVYLSKQKVSDEIFNNENLYQDEIQEYFILKRKNFFDSYLKPVQVRKFIPLLKFKRKYYSVKRKRISLKGLIFFYFRDYENRISVKEQQQKTLRIYEGLYGTFIFRELLKKEDHKPAKFIRMKMHRDL